MCDAAAAAFLALAVRCMFSWAVFRSNRNSAPWILLHIMCCDDNLRRFFQTMRERMPVARSHPERLMNGNETSIYNLTHSQHPKKRTVRVTININGTENEVTAKLDPHSFYTILNVYPEGVRLGEQVEIARKNGKKKVPGRVITAAIYIDGQKTADQILYVGTFRENIIGWKQLRDLGLMEVDTQCGFVTDVPPVLIKGDIDCDNFHERYLKKDLIGDACRVIASWVRKGLIERCDSVCNASVSLAMKPNGKVKIIFHFQDLNAFAEEEVCHPQVHRPKAIEAITLGKYYSVFRLFYAEWQIPLDTYTKHKTAFTFLGKQYVWNRLPGGFKNTISRLSEALEKVLHKLPPQLGGRVTYYVDTILISGDTKQECEELTAKLQRHLKDNNFEIRHAQQQTSKPVVQFLGREVTKDGVRLGKDFIKKVENIQLPRNVQELQSIFLFLSDAVQYTPGLSILTKIIKKLTENNCEFFWDGKPEAELFRRLKDRVLANRFVVPGLTENEACTVQISVKDGAWMARILNSAKKPYRFGSDIFQPLKKKDTLAIQELKAMKGVWNKYERVLENRDVEWEVESPDIARYKDDPDGVTIGKRLKLDFLKSSRCKVKVVPADDRDPPFPWPQNL